VRPAMRGLALAGDRQGVALFEEFATRLKRELGAEPDADTRVLAERIRRERTWRVPATPAHCRIARAGSRRGPLWGAARSSSVWWMRGPDAGPRRGQPSP